MSSRSARSLPYTYLRKKEEAEKMDVMLLVWGTNGKWAAQRVQCGRMKAKLVRKTEVCLLVAPVKALCATMRCTSSGCSGPGGKISLLMDWELAKAARCHMALDSARKCMRPGWVLLRGLLSRHAFSHSSPWAEERVVVRVNSEKEAWQVLVDSAGLLVAFLSIFVACTPCAFLQ